MALRLRKITALIICGVIAVTACGCNTAEPENEIFVPITGETNISYKTAKAEYQTIEQIEKIPANLAFAKKTSFTAPYDSKVKEILVKKFDNVKAGDKLMVLDTTDIDFKITELQIKINTMSSSIDIGYAQIELDKLLEQREAAVVIAPYDGVIDTIAYLQVGSDVNSGEALCSVCVPDSIFVYNSEGAGKNLRFNMDVDLKINDIEYKGIVTSAPDTAPSTATSSVKKYCAVSLPEAERERLINENDGVSAVDAGWATIIATTVRRVNVLAVPDSAIKKDGSQSIISILQGNEKYEMPVEIGVSCGGYTEILSGINEGDVVVLTD